MLDVQSTCGGKSLSEAVKSSASHSGTGHRMRLRQRLLKGGPESLADYELLEFLLFAAIRQGDTKPLAKRLITQFGSFSGVLSAAPASLAHHLPMDCHTPVAHVHLARATLLAGARTLCAIPHRRVTVVAPRHLHLLVGGGEVLLVAGVATSS